jgi:hypothetical protein
VEWNDTIYDLIFVFQLLTKCRKIHLLDNGKIVKSATYTEFLECGTFPRVYKEYEVLRNSAG